MGKSDGLELDDAAAVAVVLRKFEFIVVSLEVDSVDFRWMSLWLAHDTVLVAAVVKLLLGEMSHEGALLWRLFDKFVWWSIFFCVLEKSSEED